MYTRRGPRHSSSSSFTWRLSLFSLKFIMRFFLVLELFRIDSLSLSLSLSLPSLNSSYSFSNSSSPLTASTLSSSLSLPTHSILSNSKAPLSPILLSAHSTVLAFDNPGRGRARSAVWLAFEISSDELCQADRVCHGCLALSPVGA